MSILYDNKDVKKFLKAWGIDMSLVKEVTIHIPENDVVTVTVEKLTMADPNKLQEIMTEEYYLMKRE